MHALRLQQTHPGWTFWLRWMLGTSGGLVVGIIAWLLMNLVASQLAPREPGAGSPSPVIQVLIVASWSALGLGFGLGQWWVLRRELDRAGWWVLATAAGYPLGSLLPQAVLSVNNPSLAGLALPDSFGQALGGLVMLCSFGAALGVMQSLVLRGQVKRAILWIPMSIGGWLLAFAATALAFLSGIYVEPLDMLAAFFVPTASTGVGMAWLLQQGRA